MNVVRVLSKGSLWLFDEEERRYCRMPREERPRERPEWSDERAGALQDFVWHDYRAWLITDRWMFTTKNGVKRWVLPDSLIIEMPNGTWSVAPDASIQ